MTKGDSFNERSVLKILSIILFCLILSMSTIPAFAKSSHGNSAFGHSHKTSTSSSSNGGGRDFIYSCIVNYEYRDFYQYQLNPKSTYNNYMNEHSLQILQFYNAYKHNGVYCGVPKLEFGDLS